MTKKRSKSVTVEKNDIIKAEIISMSSEGAGVAKKDGYVIFVPFSYIGDILEIKILKVKNNIAYGKAVKIKEPSGMRRTPPCGFFKACGGCTLMHIKYEAQLEYKRKKVEEALKRIGGLDIKVEKVVPSEERGYRNKALIPVGFDKAGNITCGFYRRNSHDIISSRNCFIQDRQVDAVCEAVTGWMKDNGVKPYDREKKTGAVRHIYFRKAFSNNSITAGIVTGGGKIKETDSLTERLKSIDGVVSVIRNINDKDTNVILGEKTEILYGEKYLTDSISDKEFEIGPLSFYQVNHEQCERLYAKAAELLEINENDILYDIYCGIGTIGICAAGKAKKLIGVEVVKEAVECAKRNAKRNGIENAEYYCAKAEEMKFPESEKPTAVVIDPPRKGCDRELINSLLELAPERICYISCDPATLARDLRIFAESGKYSIGKVYPFDMFPDTEHCESIVRLIRSDINS